MFEIPIYLALGLLLWFWGRHELRMMRELDAQDEERFWREDLPRLAKEAAQKYDLMFGEESRSGTFH